VQSPLEGLARALTGVTGGYIAKQENERDEARRNAYNETLTKALGAGGTDATSILGGNPDTAALALSRQFGQQDTADARTAGREDYLFQQQNQAPPVPVPGRDVPYSPEVAAQRVAERKAGKAETNINVGTKGQVKVDEAFASDFNELVAGGGFADMDKSMEQLGEVVKALESGQDLTGTFLGNLPDTVRSAINPESINTQNLVEEVVQRNLRIVLGAQFTEKEGERLIARAYNPRLDEKTNAARVGRLMTALKTARDAKFAAAKYFQENGTLAGYQGVQRFSMDDLEKAADLPDDLNTENGSTSSGAVYEIIDGNLTKVP
jgi:hypothetical protein